MKPKSGIDDLRKRFPGANITKDPSAENVYPPGFVIKPKPIPGPKFKR